MMLGILKKLGFSENGAKKMIERYTRIKMIISAVFYTVMVFIVIFGISGDVYAGFPKVVPYIIMAVFMFMAFVRMYQCMVDDNYINKIAAQKSAGESRRNAQAESVSPSGDDANGGLSSDEAAPGKKDSPDGKDE